MTPLRAVSAKPVPVDVASDSLLKLADVSVRFGSRDVLAQASLAIRPGEFVTLLGPSGCGKSTLLNMAAGTLKPNAGTVEFAGEAVTSINRNVGYVTQDDTMLPWLTLSANVALPLKMRGRPAAEAKARAAELLESFGLGHAGALYPAQLSGGMKKRGLLARALIYQPRLLLMDEPFAALDAQLRTQLQVELRRVAASTGVAVLFVTHDIEEALLLSDRVVVVGGVPGRIMASFDVPFGAERDAETLRFDDGFRDLGRRLQDALRHARGDA